MPKYYFAGKDKKTYLMWKLAQNRAFYKRSDLISFLLAFVSEPKPWLVYKFLSKCLGKIAAYVLCWSQRRAGTDWEICLFTKKEKTKTFKLTPVHAIENTLNRTIVTIDPHMAPYLKQVFTAILFISTNLLTELWEKNWWCIECRDAHHH